MQHPDEGTIHAWLDGALSTDDARALEAHVAECAACAAAVTEARGLLAASSRILSALDSVPGGVLPAAEPEIEQDQRVIPIGRSSRWRSPGLRAAAAILLVGSVSWLATRSVGRQAEGTLESPREISSTAADTTLPPSRRLQADAVAGVGAASAPPSAPPNRERIARSGAAGQGAATGRAKAKADAPVMPPTPAPQVVAEPLAIPYAMPKLVESPNAGVGAGAGGQATMLAQSAAPAAQAPSAASANAAEREERRAADAGFSMRGAAKAAARAKSSAPTAVRGALSREVASPTRDLAAERLAGCYHIETAASQSSAPAIHSAASLVPAQVELRVERDSSAGGDWRILRPAPGAPPFRLAARASWMVLVADSVQLELGDGMESVSARFAVKGDSLHGHAVFSGPALPTGGTGTDMRGSRMPCSTP